MDRRTRVSICEVGLSRVVETHNLENWASETLRRLVALEGQSQRNRKKTTTKKLFDNVDLKLLRYLLSSNWFREGIRPPADNWKLLRKWWAKTTEEGLILVFSLVPLKSFTFCNLLSSPNFFLELNLCASLSLF